MRNFWVVLLSLVAISAQAAVSGGPRRVAPVYNSYYGEAFYRAMQNRSSGENMKDLVRGILQSEHRAIPGKYDEISNHCNGQGCYAHRSLGYGNARIFLLGYFYLVKSGNAYGVREVYCQRVYGAEEFPNEKPAPKRVPDDTVVNVEHTWPQSRFSARYSKELQKSDLHHLFPTDSQMNSTRSSYQFGVVQDDQGKLKCNASKFGRAAGYNGPVFEPPQQHKGNVARALFYFSTRYETNISPVEERTLREWNKLDPVDEEEMTRNNEIYKVQGSRNPFVDHPELADRIQDF